MGSSRLPGKVLMNLDKTNSVLYYVISQLQNCKLLDEIVIATTNLKEDKKIIEFSKKKQINFFQGSSDDVLDRFYQCAKKFSFPIIVRITADCPLIDPSKVDFVVQKYVDNSFDYVNTHSPRTFPQGSADIEVFSFKLLEEAWKNAKKPSEREHVTPYFYNNPKKFKIFSCQNSKNLSKLKWSVDREPDLNFVKEIISRIEKRPILTEDILKIFEKEPHLLEINSNYVFEEGYMKSLEQDKKLGY